ncbi:MAG: hypothetical protein J5883_06295 [Clostridiales bacterium]|nr:hypothetical protein [Clostridiales bacterium]
METWKKEVKIILGTFAALVAVSLYRQFYMNLYPENYLYPYAVYLMYMAIALAWDFKVNRTVKNDRMRKFLMQELAVMSVWLTIKMVMESQVTDPDLIRKLGYYIAVPIVFIPMYGLFAASCLGKGNDKGFDGRLRLLYIPAFIITGATVTNDMHHMVFDIYPEPGIEIDYHPRFGFYILCAWVIVLLALRIMIMMKNSNERSGRNSRFTIWVTAVVIPVLIILYAVISFVRPGFELMEFTAIMFFSDGLIWESGVIGGSISINSRYGRIFDISTMAMQIVDRDGNVIKRSKSASVVEKDVFEKLREEGRLQLNRDTELRINPITRGYVIWENEITQIHDLIDRFKSDEENLQNDVSILEEELRVSSGQVRESEQSRILTDVTKEISGEISLLKELLKKAEDPEVRDETLRKVNIVGTYIKRHCAVSIAERSEGRSEDRDIILFWKDMAKAMERAGYTVDLNIATENIEDILTHLKRLEELEKRIEEGNFIPKLFTIDVGPYDAEVIESV